MGEKIIRSCSQYIHYSTRDKQNPKKKKKSVKETSLRTNEQDFSYNKAEDAASGISEKALFATGPGTVGFGW